MKHLLALPLVAFFSISSNLYGQLISEDFESGLTSLTVTGGTIANTCYNGNGNLWLNFNGLPERRVETGPLNLTIGENFQVDFVFLTRTSGSTSPGCDYQESSDRMFFQYSLNGTTWTSLSSHYYGTASGGRQNVSIALPAAAISTTTYLRWNQPSWSMSTSVSDNWGLDDVLLTGDIFPPPPPIPTMSEWGLIAFCLLLSSLVSVSLYRRKKYALA